MDGICRILGAEATRLTSSNMLTTTQRGLYYLRLSYWLNTPTAAKQRGLNYLQLSRWLNTPTAAKQRGLYYLLLSHWLNTPTAAK